MTKDRIKKLLEENLSVEFSTESACSCCDSGCLKLSVKFDGDIVCSDFIYLSSICKG